MGEATGPLIGNALEVQRLRVALAAAERARGEAERETRERFERCRTDWSREVKRLRDRAEAAEARLSLAVGALETYGDHLPACEWRPVGGAVCTCGFDAALKAKVEADGGTR
jgi:hypothetical protein